MKSYKKMYLFLILLAISYSNVEAETCKKLFLNYSNFIAKPAQSTLSKFSQSMKNDKHNVDKCRIQFSTSLAEDPRLGYKLIEYISSENKYALEVAILILFYVDGGYLEDLIRSINSYISYDTEYVLKQFKKHKAPPIAIKTILNSFPLKLKNDENAYLDEINRRIKFLKSIRSAELFDLRDFCLKIYSGSGVGPR